jgi:large subunit ribosomal protein L24
MSTDIKKGDTVVVIAGKDKGKSGKVLMVEQAEGKLVVEGINKVKKHRKRRSEQQQSGIVELEAAIQRANVALWCTSCKRGVRFSVKVNADKSKTRLCSKCKAQI